MPACVQLNHVSKRYGKVAAVEDLSLQVETGEVVGILGANGAGKSTTLYMLSNLVLPTSGEIRIFGKNAHTNFTEIAGRMGVLVERPAFYDHLSARENLQILAMLAGREITVDRALRRVGLLREASRKISAFSLGMRQRLGLAQAILTEPALLILDEPTGGLDAEGSQDILYFLRELAEESQVTVVFTSHMLQEVEFLADRIAVLDHGKLVAVEQTQRLLSYDTSQIEVLVDAPEAAAKQLEQQPWVDSAQLLPGSIEVHLGDATAHQLTTFLVSAGFVVSGILPRRRTLKDYFVKVLKT
jgi:ABC-type multidrug transport system ATPase subunit